MLMKTQFILVLAAPLIFVKSLKIDDVNPRIMPLVNATVTIFWTREASDPSIISLVLSPDNMIGITVAGSTPILEEESSSPMNFTFDGTLEPKQYILYAMDASGGRNPDPISDPVAIAVVSEVPSTSRSENSVTSSESIPSTKTTEPPPTTSTGPSTPNATPAVQTGSAPSASVIAGAVVGSIVLLVLGITTFVCYRRRRRGNQQHSADPMALADLAISPYIDPPDLASKRQRKDHHTETPVPATRESIIVEATLNERDRQREPRIVFHDDSGWRPLGRTSLYSDEEVIIDMPPRYDAAL
ncbi:hypothetical protein Moror_3681 [Moniliophthora roreri MCA 2997]|uniref:Mid2 domain-containing protein n=2 Tax=Moniliophthora roreri TaxID=221103 RepID=V2WPU8_MONRO|nr:hypothetical protein Moror_3681 [Moniliophthora roreri MCA 2997]